jgi:putative RNA 2'-phosphotransferase
MENAGRGRPRGSRSQRRQGPPRPDTEERLSRFLAFVLRHHPEEIGLVLDEHGAVDIDTLLEQVRTRPGCKDVTREKIERLATGEAATRFEIRDNRIRARYGHSLPQPIQYEPASPPQALFHGSPPEAADQILKEGLKAMGRQRVHLSVDTPAAREVGRRRCPNPVVLRIDTGRAAAAGVRFYHGGPAVWLSDDIPPDCITRVE